MKTIPLTKGYEAIVDDDDYESISRHKWYMMTNGRDYTQYACRTKKINGKKKTFWMHRVINKTPDHLVTDHINRNGLDNRKCNLRSVTHQENMVNSKMHKKSTSEYRGVSWHSIGKCWRAAISVNNKYVHLGLFKNELDAKAAYDKKRSEITNNQLIPK